MKQIILTVEDNSLVPKLKAAVKMLQGVVSVKVMDEAETPKPNKETMEAIKEIQDGKYAIFEISHTAEAVSEFWGNLPSLLGKLPIDRTKPIIERYAVDKVANHLCEFCIPLISQ